MLSNLSSDHMLPPKKMSIYSKAISQDWSYQWREDVKPNTQGNKQTKKFIVQINAA